MGALALLRAHHWYAGPMDEEARQEALLAVVDVALWFFPGPPETVYGVSRGASGADQIHLGFAGNGMALLDFAWNLPAGGDYESLHVIGDRGAAYADDHHNCVSALASKRQSAAESPPSSMPQGRQPRPQPPPVASPRKDDSLTKPHPRSDRPSKHHSSQGHPPIPFPAKPRWI